MPGPIKETASHGARAPGKAAVPLGKFPLPENSP